MTRIACLVALLALSSPACARGYSITFRGHQVHVAAHCRFLLNCISVSAITNRRDRDNGVAATNDPAPAPAATPAPAPAASPRQAQPAATQPSAVPTRPPVVAAQAQPTPVITRAQAIAPVVQTAPPAAPTLASAPPSAVETMKPRQGPTSSAAGVQNTAKPQAKPQDDPQAKPAATSPAVPVVHRSHESEGATISPLGDWQIGGKEGGLVRIESCGAALCGYALDPSTGSKGATILVDMKLKSGTRWTGHIFSRSSGNSYYGIMTLKPGDRLHVEACALGPFFCSGNDWRRLAGKVDELVSAQHAKPEPRS